MSAKADRSLATPVAAQLKVFPFLPPLSSSLVTFFSPPSPFPPLSSRIILQCKRMCRISNSLLNFDNLPPQNKLFNNIPTILIYHTFSNLFLLNFDTLPQQNKHTNYFTHFLIIFLFLF